MWVMNIKTFTKLLTMLLVVAIILTIYSHSKTCIKESVKKVSSLPLQDLVLASWPVSSGPCLSQYDDIDYSISTLPKMIEDLAESYDEKCRSLQNLFSQLYTVNSEMGRIIIPTSFQEKVKKWLGGNQFLLNLVEEQTVIYVHNSVLGQGTIYNPLRQKRPQPEPRSAEKERIDEFTSKTTMDCDLCTYKQHTAEDVFGRLYGKYAYTMANVFKLSAWHSMVVFKTHHPLKWSLHELQDVFDVGLEWFKKVHMISPENRYPTILWDLLPSSGASQTHPHIHVLSTKGQYYGELDSWHAMSTEYTKSHGSLYFSDLLSISSVLGLVTSIEQAYAIVPLTSQIDKEVILLAQKPGSDLYRLLYYVLKVFSQHYNKSSFSMAMTLPPLGEHHTDIPVLVRIAPRGSTTPHQSDVTSLNLFSAAEVNTDPFRLAQVLRQFVHQQIQKE